MKLKMTKKKLLAAIVSTALLCGVGVGGTVAWLHDSAQVTNKFDLASLTGEISENPPDEKDNVKRNVYFTNTGEVDTYIRVAVSASWTLDENGTQLANVSAENTYTTVVPNPTKWVKYGDYWYYTEPVAPKGRTEDLFTSVEPLSVDAIGEAYKGLHFRYDVSAQLIQAEPEDAVKNAWGVVITEEGVSEAPQNP